MSSVKLTNDAYRAYCRADLYYSVDTPDYREEWLEFHNQLSYAQQMEHSNARVAILAEELDKFLADPEVADYLKGPR